MEILWAKWARQQQIYRTIHGNINNHKKNATAAQLQRNLALGLA